MEIRGNYQIIYNIELIFLYLFWVKLTKQLNSFVMNFLKHLIFFSLFFITDNMNKNFKIIIIFLKNKNKRVNILL